MNCYQIYQDRSNFKNNFNRTKLFNPYIIFQNKPSALHWHLPKAATSQRTIHEYKEKIQ